MSAPAKMRRTEAQVEIKEPGKKARGYRVSQEVMMRILAIVTKRDSVPAEEVLPELGDPVERVASAFRGLRAREGLTQVEMAERLGLEQGDVSKIESGKRAIGIKLAKRIEAEFKIGYRVFL
jgi:ribosome-binding protein aMBF1 (putative translation factor)